MAVAKLLVVCKIITCVSAFKEMAIIFHEINSKSCCLSGHSALQATRRMPLWALAIALATGKNTKLLGMLDQNKRGFFTYKSQHAKSKAATVTMSVSFTVAGDFVLRLICPKYLWSKLQRAETLFLWLTKCTDRKQPLNLSKAHARVYYLLLGEAKE